LKSGPQRFQSLRRDQPQNPVPDLSRYQPQPKSQVRKATSQRNLRGAYARMDLNGLGEGGAEGSKYPERPEDVRGGGERIGVDEWACSHEDFIFELEG